MRKWVVITAVVAVVAAVPVAVLAATGGGNSAVNCQAVAWRTTAVSTSSSSFTTIGGLKPTVNSIFPMSITVSAVVSGEPVAFRLRDVSVAGSKVVQPGIAPFVTNGAAANSFSYTWTDPGIAAAVRGHQFLVQWRRTSGTGSSTLQRADIVVVFQGEPGACRS
jgi:hypothetical protein